METKMEKKTLTSANGKTTFTVCNLVKWKTTYGLGKVKVKENVDLYSTSS